ncbi:MAG: N-acetyl-gamma-glutamyl-phosphate reductase [Limnochordia bacterium]
MIRVGIVGASGYTGSELIRLLGQHPHVRLECLASRTLGGQAVATHQPSMAGWASWDYESLDVADMAQRCDVIFTAVPHGAAMEPAAIALAAGKRLIDLGTDFRFRDLTVYEHWYKIPHVQRELNKEAVYGLPELFRESIAQARLVANPGCYPTSALLALAPLARHGDLDTSSIVINSVSGVSGAGATPKPMYHFPDCTENVQAYGTATHRHTPEIEQGIAALTSDKDVRVSFTPHLVPMSRGILTTAVCSLRSSHWTNASLNDLYEEFYRQEPFVVVLGTDRLPQTKAVWGSNYCHLSVRFDERTNRAVIQATIDNLVKGAAGQAVQNMNLLFGLPETTGLSSPGLMP